MYNTVSDNSNSRCRDRKTAYVMMLECERSHMPIFSKTEGNVPSGKLPQRLIDSSVLQNESWTSDISTIISCLWWLSFIEKMWPSLQFMHPLRQMVVLFFSPSLCFLRLGFYSHNCLNTLKLNKTKSKIESESWISISVNAHILYCICSCWLNLA